MTLVEAKAKADLIASELLALKPVVATATDGGDMIIIAFDLISHETLPWTKGIEVESIHASSRLVQDLLAKWKAEKRRDIAMNDPSPAVRKAIAVHGIKKVKEAIAT